MGCPISPGMVILIVIGLPLISDINQKQIEK